MDYSKIYRDFIADRRKTPPADGVYFERHHITPRAFGGEDDAANLIQLTPDDHLFAHLLLAKMHGGAMWLAAKAMVDMRGGTNCGRVYGVRPMFAVARRKHAEMMRGNSCPFSDKTVFNLYHHDGRTWSGTKVDFRRDFGRAYQPLSAEGHWKGWYQSAENAAMHKEIVRSRLKNARKYQMLPSNFDKTLYSFVNVETGKMVEETRMGMQRLYGLRPGDCWALISGRQKVARGFSLVAKGSVCAG